MTTLRPAGDGEEFSAQPNNSEWLVAWHPPATVPDGVRHGAAGICLTDDSYLVLISPDGERWGLPGGRPEPKETWDETLRRELLEEACAEVMRARLLGFVRGECISGAERGRVLVRSFWKAIVRLRPWAPEFEISSRMVIPAHEWRQHLWIEHSYDSIYLRAFTEADL